MGPGVLKIKIKEREKIFVVSWLEGAKTPICTSNENEARYVEVE